MQQEIQATKKAAPKMQHQKQAPQKEASKRKQPSCTKT